MKLIKVPAINGLGKTNSTLNFADLLINDPIYEINLANKTLPEQQDHIHKESQRLMEKENQIFFIGGDHSISYPIGRAFQEYCTKRNKEPFLIIFDAHADCMPPMQEPTHEEWLRALISSGFPSQNIILIGARNIDSAEKNYLEKTKIKQISVKDIEQNLEKSIESILEHASEKTCYISFDIDVFDSSIVKATGYPEPNGLNEEQVTQILQELKKNLKIKIIDLVEISTDKPEIKKTLKLASNILTLFTKN